MHTEQTRAARSQVRSSQRELAREVQRLEREERKLIADIKKAAKRGDKRTTGTLAKSLVRLRKQKERMVGASAQMGAVNNRIATQAATRSSAEALASATQAMKVSNTAMSVSAVTGVATEFARQSEMMDMKEEMMNDAIDGAMDSASDDEEVDAVFAQVLDGIALDATSQMAPAPSSAVGSSTQTALSADEVQAEEDRIFAELLAGS